MARRTSRKKSARRTSRRSTRRSTKRRVRRKAYYIHYKTPKGSKKTKRLGATKATAGAKLKAFKSRVRGKGYRILGTFSCAGGIVQARSLMGPKKKAKKTKAKKRRTSRRPRRNSRRQSARRSSRRSSRRKRRRTTRRRRAS